MSSRDTGFPLQVEDSQKYVFKGSVCIVCDTLDYDPEVVGWLLCVLKSNLKAQRCDSSLSQREGAVSCRRGKGVWTPKTELIPHVHHLSLHHIERETPCLDLRRFLMSCWPRS